MRRRRPIRRPVQRTAAPHATLTSFQAVGRVWYVDVRPEHIVRVRRGYGGVPPMIRT